jgi:hypothetical protein
VTRVELLTRDLDDATRAIRVRVDAGARRGATA